MREAVKIARESADQADGDGEIYIAIVIADAIEALITGGDDE